jgi:hypothetical protein
MHQKKKTKVNPKQVVSLLQLIQAQNDTIQKLESENTELLQEIEKLKEDKNQLSDIVTEQNQNIKVKNDLLVEQNNILKEFYSTQVKILSQSDFVQTEYIDLKEINETYLLNNQPFLVSNATETYLVNKAAESNEPYLVSNEPESNETCLVSNESDSNETCLVNNATGSDIKQRKNCIIA